MINQTFFSYAHFPQTIDWEERPARFLQDEIHHI